MPTPVGYRKYKNDTEKAKTYNHRLATADKDYDAWAPKAADWYSRYENVPRSSQSTSKGMFINVPTAVSVIDALFSGLTAVDVEFTSEAIAHATPEQGYLAEAALNQEWNHLHVDEDRDDAIKDALVTGIGWVKVGYDFFEDEQTVDRDIDEVRAEVNDLIEEAREAGAAAPTADQIAKLVPTQEKVTFSIRDRLVVDYVPWDQIRYDPSARRVKDVRWVAQLTKMHLHEVKGNDAWRAYAKRSRTGLSRLDGIKADAAIDKELLVTGKPLDDDGRVTVVEFWDLETGTICTFIKGQSWLLHEGVNPFALAPDFQDRSPFVPLVLRKTTRRLRGISDMDVMERSLNEKNLYRSRTAEYIRRAVPKVVGPEDALTEEGAKNLESDQVLGYVSVTQQTDPHAIIPLEPPPLAEQVFDMSDRIDDEIREATGVNELMRGLFPEKRQTATSVNEVVSASAARQSEKRNTLERFHVEVAKRMLHLMQEFYDQPRMVRYVDPSMGNVPWEFSGEDILGDFDIKVTLNPREAMTRDTQRQEATVALNVLGPLAQPDQTGSSTIDPVRLVEWYMRKYGFSPRDINELLNSDAEKEKQTQQALGLQGAAAAAQQGAAQLAGTGVSPDTAAGSQGVGPGSVEAAVDVAKSAGAGPPLPTTG